MDAMAESQRLARFETGVPGLDTVLNGGMFRAGVYIIEGAPGSGKTILGNQICFYRASQGESTAYVTLLAESHTRMIAHLRAMKFFQPELVTRAIQYTSAFKVLEEAGLEGLLKSIRESVFSRKATFLVLDGLVSVEEFAPSARDFKKFIHELQTVTSLTGCTVVLLSSTERAASFRPEHTMVDGLIELGETLVGEQSLRHIAVHKMRGADQMRGRHSVEITDAGLKVRPRIEALLQPATESDPPPPATPVATFDVAGLDEMLHGGLRGGSTTIVLGATGTGKTMLGLQFLDAGIKLEQRCLYIGFYERPAGLLAKAKRLRLGLEDGHARGLVHLYWEAPVEGVLDALAERLLHAVRENDIKRLVFDGLHGFRRHADFPGRTRSVFAAITDELMRRGVTSLFTMETTELIGPKIDVPIEGISALADNLIMLRHVEVRSRLHRAVSILKVRDHGYDSRIRELTISDDGVAVAGPFENADRLLSGLARTVTERVEEH